MNKRFIFLLFLHFFGLPQNFSVLSSLFVSSRVASIEFEFYLHHKINGFGSVSQFNSYKMLHSPLRTAATSFLLRATYSCQFDGVKKHAQYNVLHVRSAISVYVCAGTGGGKKNSPVWCNNAKMCETKILIVCLSSWNSSEYTRTPFEWLLQSMRYLYTHTHSHNHSLNFQSR